MFPQYTPEPTLLCTFIPEIHEFAHGKPHYWCYTFSVTLFFLPPLKKKFFFFSHSIFPFLKCNSVTIKENRRQTLENQTFTASAKCYTFSYTFVTLFISSISVTLFQPKMACSSPVSGGPYDRWYDTKHPLVLG